MGEPQGLGLQDRFPPESRRDHRIVDRLVDDLGVLDFIRPDAFETCRLDGLLDDFVRGVQVQLSPGTIVNLLPETLDNKTDL